MFKKYFLQPVSVRSTRKHVDLTDEYNQLLSRKGFCHDPAQLQVVGYLQTLLEKVVLQDKCQQRPLAGRLITRTSVVSFRHLYIYGGVGHGKSMLMDLFFSACPVVQKRRVHFHAFMQEVHAFVHRYRQRNRPDVITALARQIRNSALLLCFDEFHVTDIADAMIMERLFRQLFELGVVVVMTSNRHPSDLYRGGLLRDQFVPFVKLLLESANVVELSGEIDYRSIRPEADQKRYFYPLNEAADDFVLQSFFQHSHARSLTPAIIHVFGRDIELTAVHGDTALTSFEQLCKRSLGAADYLQIAKQFRTLIMAGVPRLAPDFCDEARRFEILIDTLYEHKVKFICSAEAHPRDIYKEGEGAFEFKRTVSRLLEMQSDGY